MKITEKDIPYIVGGVVILGGLSAGGYFGYRYYTTKESIDASPEQDHSNDEKSLEEYKKYGMWSAGAVVVGLIAVMVFRMRNKKNSGDDEKCDLNSESVCEVSDDDSDEEYNKTNVLTF